MQILIGSDAGEYVFDPASRTIYITGIDYNLKLRNILTILNVTHGLVIYNFAKAGVNGSVANNVLTLDYDTSAMSSSDELQVWIDVPAETQLDDIGYALNRIAALLSSLPYVDRSLNRARSTAILESGTLTTLATCGTCTTLANVGSYAGNVLAFVASNNAWHNSVGRRFS